jgi:hypothetical protein
MATKKKSLKKKLPAVDEAKLEKWKKQGEVLAKAKNGNQWAIGDWILAGVETFGTTKAYDKAEQATGMTRATLQQFKLTAESFLPISTRVKNLSFGHHRLVSNIELRPEWLAWKDAEDRCVNPKNQHWKDNGGRGIKCLFKSYKQFFAQLGPRPAGMMLDRKDKDGNYEPGNVRWKKNEEQNATDKRTLLLKHAEDNKESVASFAAFLETLKQDAAPETPPADVAASKVIRACDSFLKNFQNDNFDTLLDERSSPAARTKVLDRLKDAIVELNEKVEELEVAWGVKVRGAGAGK